MNKLLIITRDFPPYEGRGNVMRILKFAKYLPEYGWRASVLCEKKGVIGDASLVEEIEGKAEIIPVEYESPSAKKNYHKKILARQPASFIQKLHSLLYRSVYYNCFMTYQNYLAAPDSSWGWAKQTIDRALGLHRQHSFHALLTSGPPFSTFRAGLVLHQSTKIPWMLDFRDGWWNNPLYSNWKKKIVALRNKHLERNVIHHAKTALFVCDPLTEIYAKRYPSTSCAMKTLPNGFDPDDFRGITTPGTKKIDTLNIVFCGSVGGRRDPSPFLTALARLKKESPQAADKVTITFVGRFRGDSNSWKQKLGNSFQITGEVSHSEAIREMAVADILLLLTHASEGGKTVMSGKIYEYAALQKPILA
ncbi:MAG: hypothetical protein GF350_16450, partial [Chitinivibrionales bacterium]|nr:hypothetical protein [Chitinivibrionales bacterium]